MSPGQRQRWPASDTGDAPASHNETTPIRAHHLAVLIWAGRIAGAALLAAMAGIHLYLWNTGYRTIPIIGPLFLANAIAGAVLCLAVLLSSGRALAWISAAGAALAAGTLAGLILSVTIGLFGFTESLRASLTTPTIAAEAAAILVLGALAIHQTAAHHPRFHRPHTADATPRS